MNYQKRLNQYLLGYYRKWMEAQKPTAFAWGELCPPYGSYTINSEADHSPIVSNAKQHCGHRYMLKVDIKNFYSSVAHEDILHALEWKINMDKEASYLILLLCTQNGMLPTGAPTSPILSELVMVDIDLMLTSKYRPQDGWTYTRYADDISLSSTEEFDSNVVVEALSGFLKSHGFQLNAHKTKYLKPNQARYVTGVKVNEKSNVDRKYIRQLRAILHHWKQQGLKAAADQYVWKYPMKMRSGYESVEDHFLKSLQGKINWVGQVKGWNDPVYLALNKRFRFLVLS